MKTTPIVAVVLLLCGCGDPFIGTWQVTTGVSTVDCGGQSSTATETGDLDFAAGSGSTLIEQGSKCDLNWTVSGNNGTLQSGQTCTSSTDAGSFTFAWTT